MILGKKCKYLNLKIKQVKVLYIFWRETGYVFFRKRSTFRSTSYFSNSFVISSSFDKETSMYLNASREMRIA